MLNDYGKSLFKPWVSVQNVVLSFAVLFVVGLVINKVNLSSSEWASWVQAIGSIAAICAAAYFPIAHEARREKRERREVLRTLSYFADSLNGYLSRISEALLEPDQHSRWLVSDDSRRLGILGQALNEIPASMMIGFELNLLTDLKYANEYAAQIDKFLKQTTPGAIKKMIDDLRYYDICQSCLADIALVEETIDGQMLAYK